MIVYILDAEIHSALSAVRSLGQRGIRVICGSHRKTALCFASRFCHETFLYTSSRQNPEQCIADIAEQANKTDSRILLMTFSDASTKACLQYADRLPKNILFPSASVPQALKAFDKAHVLTRAEEMQIGVPKTYRRSEEVMFPVVVKPQQTTEWREGKAIEGTAMFAHSKEELDHACKEFFQLRGHMPLIQACVVGDEAGYFALAKEGAVLAQFAHRRIRSISPTGGASTLRASAPIDPVMERNSKKLITELKWTGPIMVEWKQDRDGVWKLMEVNPRFWGSLPLAVHAGVDFPYLFFQMADDKEVEAPVSYNTDIKSRHLLADGKHVLRVLAGPYPFMKKIRTFFSFFIFWAPDLKYDVISIRDPKPFFAEIWDHLC